MTTFTELLPQIKDFWELRDRESQFVQVLVYTTVLSYSYDKTRKYIEPEMSRERERESNEHHCTFRSLLIYVKTGQIIFREGNHYAITLKINVKHFRIINENSVSTSEADC